MSLPFVTRKPTKAELGALRLMLSTFRDGSGWERERDGSTRPGWRQIERVFAELLTRGDGFENKGVFDVVAPSWKLPRRAYGLCIKSKQLSNVEFDQLANGGRAYIEVSNANSRFRDALERCGIGESVLARGLKAPMAGQCVLSAIRDLHREAKTSFEKPDSEFAVDLNKSVYLCLYYDERTPASRRWRACGFGLDFPKNLRWSYRGRALVGIEPDLPDKPAIEWYWKGGGQMKYHPRADTARVTSDIFRLAQPAAHDLRGKAEEYWAAEWKAIEAELADPP